MENSKQNKKPFYKRLLPIVSILIITLIGGFFYYATNSLPFEAKILLKHLNKQKRTGDMIDNPEKYQNLPCLEVQAGKDKYCFDRSRVSSVSIYDKPQSDEFQALKFQFISKLLPRSKKNKKNGGNYLLSDIYIRNYKKNIKPYMGIYQKQYFIDNNDNGCVDYTDLLKTKPQITVVYAREYIKKDKSIGIRTRTISVDPDKYKDNYEFYKKFNFSGGGVKGIDGMYQNTNKIYYTHYYYCLNNKNPTTRTNMKIRENKYWDFIVDMNHYDSKQKKVLNFNYYSNINNDIKEAALIGHQIAEEIAQFLQKSSYITPKPLTTF